MPFGVQSKATPGPAKNAVSLIGKWMQVGAKSPAMHVASSLKKTSSIPEPSGPTETEAKTAHVLDNRSHTHWPTRDSTPPSMFETSTQALPDVTAFLPKPAVNGDAEESSMSVPKLARAGNETSCEQINSFVTTRGYPSRCKRKLHGFIDVCLAKASSPVDQLQVSPLHAHTSSHGKRTFLVKSQTFLRLST